MSAKFNAEPDSIVIACSKEVTPSPKVIPALLKLITCPEPKFVLSVKSASERFTTLFEPSAAIVLFIVTAFSSPLPTPLIESMPSLLRVIFWLNTPPVMLLYVREASPVLPEKFRWQSTTILAFSPKKDFLPSITSSPHSTTASPLKPLLSPVSVSAASPAFWNSAFISSATVSLIRLPANVVLFSSPEISKINFAPSEM